MFYEEEIINGKWYWRGTPNGEWTLMGIEDLTKKIEIMQNTINLLMHQNESLANKKQLVWSEVI